MEKGIDSGSSDGVSVIEEEPDELGDNMDVGPDFGEDVGCGEGVCQDEELLGE